MAMTHRLKIKVNGTSIEGKVDLSQSDKYELDITGDLSMTQKGMKLFSNMLIAIANYCISVNQLEELEITEIV